jgi:hypothetical protein
MFFTLKKILFYSRFFARNFIGLDENIFERGNCLKTVFAHLEMEKSSLAAYPSKTSNLKLYLKFSPIFSSSFCAVSSILVAQCLGGS